MFQSVLFQSMTFDSIRDNSYFTITSLESPYETKSETLIFTGISHKFTIFKKMNHWEFLKFTCTLVANLKEKSETYLGFLFRI